MTRRKVDPLADRAAFYLRLLRGMPRFADTSEDELRAMARRQAEEELAAAQAKTERVAERARRDGLPRRKGRHPWPKGLVARRYREAVHATPDPKTPGRIAEHFVRLDGSRGIDRDSLSRLLRQNGIRAG